MKKLIALCLSIILVGCSNATETTKTRSIKVKQQKLELNSELKNVAVFDMASLDMLDYLKIDVAGVAKDSIPKYLSKYLLGTYSIPTRYLLGTYQRY